MKTLLENATHFVLMIVTGLRHIVQNTSFLIQRSLNAYLTTLAQNCFSTLYGTTYVWGKKCLGKK